MKNALKLIVLSAVILIAAPALAGNTNDPGINKMQRIQRHKIMQGIKSGELTRREALKLKREQVHVARKEARFKSDGTLTRKERAMLHRDLNHACRHIYREKHDRQHRGQRQSRVFWGFIIYK